MFHSLQLKSRYDALSRHELYITDILDQASVSTVDTMALAEYSVDETDGMAREYDIEGWGKCQLPHEDDIGELDQSK